MDKITIHGFAPSTYTRTARMTAIEKGVAHDLQPVAYGKPDHFALHPFGKMPILTHGDVTIFETVAIVSYVDETFGDPSLFGTTAGEKAAILSAISAAIDYAYRPVVHIEVTDGKPEAETYVSTKRVLDWLEKQLNANAYLATDSLSAADLFFAPMIAYHLAETGEKMTLGTRPKLKSWLDGISARPAFADTAVK